jgi:drug/metabolite transporter (DMT)-like permease
MTKIKELGSFILGLILIIGGLISFVSIPVITQREVDINVNILTALGLILLVLGSISMYFFLKTEDKKKKTSKQ